MTAFPDEPNSFPMDPETMRRIGYAAVDRAVDHLSRLEEQPAWTMLTRSEAEARIREPVPEAGRPLEALMERAERDVLAHGVRLGHPRFLAFVPSAATFPGVVAEILAAAHNPFVGTWVGGSGPTMVELTVLDWIREMTGLPEGAGGLLTSGGSAANLMALVAARHARLEDRTAGAVIYASDRTHTAITRAAWIAGFAPDAVRLLPADSGDRLDPGRVAEAVGADRAAGRRPFLVVANAGTTSTGAVDPMGDLAALCRREDLWFHVDAAYGGFAAVTDRGRKLLAGMEEADSWVFDPHKWLYQGLECGSVLLRRPEELARAFDLHADYLQDVKLDEERPNLADRGLQLSRSFRALKVWLTVGHFGLAAIRREVDRTLDLARFLEARVREDPAFELLSPARLGVVCFRLAPAAGEDDAAVEARNRAALEALNAGGYAFLSSTRAGGRFALRVCILSYRTREEDLAGVLDRLRAGGGSPG